LQFSRAESDYATQTVYDYITKDQPKTFAMIPYFISIFPIAVTALVSVIVTWLLCKFWFNTHYVHTRDVKPLQESQYAMQNQYAILADRIKNADQKMQELSKQLEFEKNGHHAANIKIAVLENKILEDQANLPMGMDPALKAELLQLLESQHNKSSNDDAEKSRLKELINIMRQSIQEFKMDLSQKLSSSSTQQNELTAQIWQLLEINKKLSEETSTLSKALSSFIATAEKNQDRAFTLTSIHKRS
jgi:DNA anti-recombination protein RmuC